FILSAAGALRRAVAARSLPRTAVTRRARWSRPCALRRRRCGRRRWGGRRSRTALNRRAETPRHGATRRRRRDWRAETARRRCSRGCRRRWRAVAVRRCAERWIPPARSLSSVDGPALSTVEGPAGCAVLRRNDRRGWLGGSRHTIVDARAGDAAVRTRKNRAGRRRIRRRTTRDGELTIVGRRPPTCRRQLPTGNRSTGHRRLIAGYWRLTPGLMRETTGWSRRDDEGRVRGQRARIDRVA